MNVRLRMYQVLLFKFGRLLCKGSMGYDIFSAMVLCEGARGALLSSAVCTTKLKYADFGSAKSPFTRSLGDCIAKWRSSRYWAESIQRCLWLPLYSPCLMLEHSTTARC